MYKKDRLIGKALLYASPTNRFNTEKHNGIVDMRLTAIAI